MVKDSIANLIVKLKNAGTSGNTALEVPYSKLTESILALLMKEGYIKSFSKKGSSSKTDKKLTKSIDIELLYEDGKSKVEGVARVSKLSKRIYMGSKDIRPVRSGYGMLVISTPKGIISDSDARKQHVGGEVLFKIW